MTLERGHEPHPGTPWVWRDPDVLWSERTCSFCGSLPPEEFEHFLGREKVSAWGTPWRGGWPHKFYVEDDSGNRWKFYTEHLTIAPNFDELTERLALLMSVRFGYDLAGRLNFWAPSIGFTRTVVQGVPRDLS